MGENRLDIRACRGDNALTRFNGRKIEPLKDEATKLLLTERLVSGDSSVIETLLMGHLGLISKRARSFVNKYSGVEHDDLVSDAILKITKALTKITAERTPIENISRYIGVLAKWSMKQTIRERHVVRVPPSTQLQGEKPPKVKNNGHVNKADFRNQLAVIEAKELLKAICTCKFEEVVLMLREMGKTDSEIAAMFKVSTSHIWETRRSLERRYNERVAAKVQRGIK
jgi:DNA-directed RNA polymerase specialized sigma24 family protein